jgi:hypothetical protein
MVCVQIVKKNIDSIKIEADPKVILSPYSRQEKAKADTVYYGGVFLWEKSEKLIQ